MSCPRPEGGRLGIEGRGEGSRGRPAGGCGRFPAPSGAFRLLWYAEKWLLFAAATGREGGSRAGKAGAGRTGGHKKPAEVPTATPCTFASRAKRGPAPGWPGSRGVRAAGAAAWRCWGVREARRAYDLLHCSASVRSLLLGSCHCRAAGTHAHAEHPSPRSPGSGSSRLPRHEVLADNPLAGGASREEGGGPRLGGVRQGGPVFPRKAALPSLRAGRPEPEGCNSGSRDPPAPPGAGWPGAPAFTVLM